MLALELEVGGKYFAVGTTVDVLDARVLENRRVEWDCVFKSGVEPEEWCDLGHVAGFLRGE